MNTINPGDSFLQAMAVYIIIYVISGCFIFCSDNQFFLIFVANHKKKKPFPARSYILEILDTQNLWDCVSVHVILVLKEV